MTDDIDMWMARHHQRWLTINAVLLGAALVLAFLVSHWLFGQAAVFALGVLDRRRWRRDALGRGKA